MSAEDHDPQSGIGADRRSTARAAHSSADGAAPAPPAPGSFPLAGKTAGVIGGGPGGMLCAAQLARLGAAVEVFERTEEDAELPARSISLGRCAKEAIEAAGLSSDFGPELRCEGIVLHRVAGEDQYDSWDVPPSAGCVAMATQRDIVAHLIAECERVHGGAVTVARGWQAVGGKVCAGEVVLARGGSGAGVAGERQTRRFDLVVGADGANSSVRELMQEHVPGMQVNIGTSGQGIVCVPLSPQGKPSVVATLPTPSGRPFQTTPPDHTRPLSGSVKSFLVPNPGGNRKLNLGVVNMQRGGREVTVALGGDPVWLEAARPEAETYAALARTFPQVPKVWLQHAAAALQQQAAADDIRVQCVLAYVPEP